MTLQNYSGQCRLTDHETWKENLVSAIDQFKSQYHVLPSYILANDYTHSLLDMWTAIASQRIDNPNKPTHFIIDGNFIHLVYDNTIPNEVVKLQYDTFFEMENTKRTPIQRKQKKRIAA